jgi:rhodanese-related sulfurtransferase
MAIDFETTPESVRERRERGEQFTLLDVREPWEIQTARIAGTTNIPMGDIPARVQELDPEEPIVVVCHHGVRSLNVTAWLRQQGFENVQSMRGGIDAWSRTIDPKVPVY